MTALFVLIRHLHHHLRLLLLVKRHWVEGLRLAALRGPDLCERQDRLNEYIYTSRDPPAVDREYVLPVPAVCPV